MRVVIGSLFLDIDSEERKVYGIQNQFIHKMSKPPPTLEYARQKASKQP